jgi:gamma-glutamylputrescine oxidase
MNVTVRADSGASWYASRAEGIEGSAFERARLTYDLDVDVCVIGGGLAGLTAAREIARRGWSVAVLEARRVAWSASGRNTGFVLPGFGSDPRAMVERIGIDRARELWGLSEAGVAYVRAAIRDAGMAGVDPVDGWLDVSKVDNGDEMLAVASLLGQEFGATIEGWPTDQVRAALRTDHYFHAIHYPTAFHIDPLAYTRGLARAALTAGAVIFEETPALAIDPAGVRKRITTPNGRVRAAHIVLAGNAHLGPLVPGLAETVLPVTGFVAVSARLGERLGEAIAWRGAVSDTRLANHHYRVVDGDRLMWAGTGGLWPLGPGGAARQFQAAIAGIFPQLGAVELEHAWSGVMGFSLHGMPQVGEVIPGLWLANGFGRHGLNTTAMAGELIAAAITGQDDRWRLFLPYELMWAGGRLGRLVRHVSMWSFARGEDWAAGLARRREAVRRTEAQGEPVEAAAEPTPESSTAQGVSAPARPVDDVVHVDVPEVEALLRQAAGRARETHAPVDEARSPPHEGGTPADRQDPPFDRNSRDA